VPCLIFEQCGTLGLGLGTVASSVLAIKGSLRAIDCGSGATLGRRDAVGSGTLAVLYRAQRDLSARLVTVLSRQGGRITQQGRSIASHRCEIAFVCDLITSRSRRETRPRTLLTLQRASIAKITRRAKHGRVAAFGEDAITCCLIAFRRSLIGVGCGLVTVRSRLVNIRQGLILIGARLLVLACYRIRKKTALLRCLDRPVRGEHRMIV
jgi:hypothetical protein